VNSIKIVDLLQAEPNHTTASSSAAGILLSKDRKNIRQLSRLTLVVENPGSAGQMVPHFPVPSPPFPAQN